MALCSTPSHPLVIRPRRYHPPINPLPAVFFHRAHFSTSLSNFVSTSRDLNGFKPRISLVCASADPSCTEMNPPSYRIFVKGLSRSTSEGNLLKKFSQFGEINRDTHMHAWMDGWMDGFVCALKIITSRASKESLGMAYIWFDCAESTQLAVKEMNGKIYCSDDV